MLTTDEQAELAGIQLMMKLSPDTVRHLWGLSQEELLARLNELTHKEMRESNENHESRSS